MCWHIMETYTKEELDKENVSPAWIKAKWENIADDMALIPERNVRVVEEDGVVRIEVSQEIVDCIRGM